MRWTTGAIAIVLALVVSGCATTPTARSASSILAGEATTPHRLTAQESAMLDMPLPAVTGVATATRLIALTFDDGPDPRWTPRVLRILRKRRATATFFVLGSSLLRHPDLVRAERAQGAEVDCHGWRHVLLLGLPITRVLNDYRRCADALGKITGRTPAFVRPPYGLMMPAQFRALRDAGYVPVMWDVNSSPLTDPSRRLGQLLRVVHPGAIMLLHDGRKNRQGVLDVLPGLISGLRSRGYNLVTVSQLLSRGRSRPLLANTMYRRYCSRYGVPLGSAVPGFTEPTGNAE